jgi:hypothetical protein
MATRRSSGRQSSVRQLTGGRRNSESNRGGNQDRYEDDYNSTQGGYEEDYDEGGEEGYGSMQGSSFRGQGQGGQDYDDYEDQDYNTTGGYDEDEFEGSYEEDEYDDEGVEEHSYGQQNSGRSRRGFGSMSGRVVNRETVVMAVVAAHHPMVVVQVEDQVVSALLQVVRVEVHVVPAVTMMTRAIME